MRLSKRKGDGEKKWDTERDKVGVWDRAGIIELFANCCTCRMLHGPWHGSSLWSRIIISASTRFNCDDYAIVGIHMATGAVAWTGASNALPVLPHSLTLFPSSTFPFPLRATRILSTFIAQHFFWLLLSLIAWKLRNFWLKAFPTICCLCAWQIADCIVALVSYLLLLFLLQRCFLLLPWRLSCDKNSVQ